MFGIRSTLVLFALCAAVSACTSPVQNKEDLLAAAGFTLVPANTPARQASLSALPPHKFVHQVRNNVVVFTYADPTICDCLYVGNQAAYDRYSQDVFAKNIANEQQMTAQMNEMDWGPWGPGWYCSVDSRTSDSGAAGARFFARPGAACQATEGAGSMRIMWVVAIALMIAAPGWVHCAEAQNSQPANGAAPPARWPRRRIGCCGRWASMSVRRTNSRSMPTSPSTTCCRPVRSCNTPRPRMWRCNVPGGLYVEWSGDLGDRQFWYDGKSIILYDPATPFYATDAAPADIDAMLDKVVTQLGFAPPLADLLYRDPYRAVRGNVQYGFDLGMTDVNGRSCHALAFVEKDIDWQIWVDAGPQLTPCKLVITYKTQPSQPQFTAVFTDWDFAPRIAASVFTPDDTCRRGEDSV